MRADADDEPVGAITTPRSPAPELGPRATKTIYRILDATRSVFLTKGYAGTTIDEIAKQADISRASFYTYFPTKRDVLLALGADSAAIAEAYVQRFLDHDGALTRDDMRRFVDGLFDLLDVHGAFATSWTQAALEDSRIREAGMHRHLRMCELFGRLVSGPGIDADVQQRGLVTYAMLERSWGFAHLYGGDLDRAAFKDEIADWLYSRRTGPALERPRLGRRRSRLAPG
jgi:TetR/AcrR family transcriptional regulator